FISNSSCNPNFSIAVLKSVSKVLSLHVTFVSLNTRIIFSCPSFASAYQKKNKKASKVFADLEPPSLHIFFSVFSFLAFCHCSTIRGKHLPCVIITLLFGIFFGIPCILLVCTVIVFCKSVDKFWVAKYVGSV